MEGLSPREDWGGDAGSHCGVERKVGRCRRDFSLWCGTCGAGQAVACMQGRPLVGFGSRGGLNHKVHYIIL